MDFDKIKHRTWLSWAAVGLLVALCAVLAGLQYRWIREVADAESYRLREDLHYRLNLLRRDLNDEVFAACYGYIPANWEIQKLGRDLAYLSQYRNRKESGDHVVRRMAVAVPDKLDLVLLFPDAAGTHLVPGNWPPEWEAMRKSLIVRLRGGPAPLNQSSTLVEFPRFGTDTRSGPRSVEQEWLLLDLDADHIGQTLLVRNVESLPRTKRKTRVRRGSCGAHKSRRYHISFVYRLFWPNGMDSRRFCRSFGNRPPTIGRARTFRPLRLRILMRRVQQAASLRHPIPHRSPDQTAPYGTSRVHHHAGSLETIVAKGRRTNDLLAAGLLLLIFATTYALVRFSRRAQNLAELQMNFVAGVSHELRTPLTVIRTAAYNLRGDLAAQPGQVARYGALIREQAEKLSALVEQVLRYGNARAGRSTSEARTTRRSGIDRSRPACRE